MSAPIHCVSGDGSNVEADASMSGDEVYLSIEESGYVATVRLNQTTAVKLIAQITQALEKKEISK